MGLLPTPLSGDFERDESDLFYYKRAFGPDSNKKNLTYTHLLTIVTNTTVVQTNK